MHAHVQVVKRLYPVFKCSVNMSQGLALHKTALELNQPFLNVCMKETMDNMVFFSNLMYIVIKITENFLYLHN